MYEYVYVYMCAFCHSFAILAAWNLFTGNLISHFHPSQRIYHSYRATSSRVGGQECSLRSPATMQRCQGFTGPNTCAGQSVPAALSTLCLSIAPKCLSAISEVVISATEVSPSPPRRDLKQEKTEGRSSQEVEPGYTGFHLLATLKSSTEC